MQGANTLRRIVSSVIDQYSFCKGRGLTLKQTIASGLVAANCLLLMFHSVSVFAEEVSDGLSVRSVEAASSIGAQAPPKVYHVIGGTEIELPIVIEGYSAEPIQVRARLIQRARLLAAAFEENLEVFSERSLDDGKPIRTSLALTLPSVNNEADFELVYQANIQGSPWFDAGRTLIRVYPEGILQPLKAMSEHVTLKVKDDRGLLTPVLESLGVSAKDYRAMALPPGLPVITLMVNTDPPENGLDPREVPIRSGETVILFNETVRTLPKVVKTPYNGGWFVEVDLVVLKDLSSDPRAQEALMEIIRLALASESGVTP